MVVHRLVNFESIRLPEDEDTVIAFRKDSFIVSFGNTNHFEQQAYLDWLSEKKTYFPEGFVLAKEKSKPIGQLELSIREFEGQEIGYVHLYYLVPEKRGKGLGKALHAYTREFFQTKDMTEYHLRVAPSNERALRFYIKNGMEKVREEVDGKVVRMRGRL